MDMNRKLWNQGHQKLHRALVRNDHHAIEIFLNQHAMVHSGNMTRSQLWSFEDEVLQGLTEQQFRCIPPHGEHSIAWILFHIAHSEDVTMNMLVAGTPQLFLQDNWANKLRVSILHSANKMNDRSIAALSAQIDMDALRSYRRSAAHAAHST